MRVFMKLWVGKTLYPVPDWFKDNEEADITADQIIELYNTGNNVMLCHFDRYNDVKMMLAIDDKRFGQR